MGEMKASVLMPVSHSGGPGNKLPFYSLYLESLEDHGYSHLPCARSPDCFSLTKACGLKGELVVFPACVLS